MTAINYGDTFLFPFVFILGGGKEPDMSTNTEVVSSIINIIGNVGFPIFVSLYLLSRFETKLDAVVKAVNELTQVISRHYK